MHLKVKMITGEDLEFDVDAPTILIGRSPKCQVVIPFEGVSRQHCMIEVVDGDIFITDLASTNGVIVGGERIPPSERYPFKTYFPLSFGSVQNMSIELESAPPTREASIPVLKFDTGVIDLQNSTRKMPDKNTVKRRPVVAPSKNFKPKSHFFMNTLIIIAVFAGLTYWYIKNKKQNPPVEETPEESLPGKPKNRESDYF